MLHAMICLVGIKHFSVTWSLGRSGTAQSPIQIKTTSLISLQRYLSLKDYCKEHNSNTIYQASKAEIYPWYMGKQRDNLKWQRYSCKVQYKRHICTTGVIQIVQVGQYILILLTFLSRPSSPLCTLHAVFFWRYCY
jgi:hypothetical protein